MQASSLISHSSCCNNLGHAVCSTQGIDRSSLFSLQHPGFRPIPTNKEELATAGRWMSCATLQAKNTFTTGSLGEVPVRSNWLLFFIFYLFCLVFFIFSLFSHLADGGVVCFGCVWSYNKTAAQRANKWMVITVVKSR